LPKGGRGEGEIAGFAGVGRVSLRAIRSDPALLAEMAEHTAALEKAVQGCRLEDLPEFEARLARVGALVRLRYVREPFPASAAPAEAGNRLLTVEEAAERLSVKKGWLYQNHASLPFTVRLGAQHLRFSALGLEEWIRAKAP
jgi:predicted DNA-binding transcriptional regulator AlpA